MHKSSGVLFLTKDNKTLILLRSSGDHKGTWGLPGGGTKHNETAVSGAKRETKEETGYFPYDAQLIKKVVDSDWTTFVYKIREPYKVKLNDEHSNFKWVDVSDLKKYKLHPDLRKDLSKYFNSNFKRFREYMES